MDDEGFRLLLAEYAHSVRNQQPEEGRLERQLKVQFARSQAESEKLQQTLTAIEHEVARVYCYFTGGKLSKCSTDHAQVIALIEDEMTARVSADSERLRAALEAFDAKLETESTFEESGQEFVAFYRVPAGPWHKILALIRGGGA